MDAQNAQDAQSKRAQSAREHRRTQLRLLIHRYFAGHNDVVVKAIRSATGRMVSLRAVQAWLIPLGQPSSRNCPEDILDALENYVSVPANQLAIKEEVRFIEQAKRGNASPFERAADVESRYVVLWATNQLRWEAERLEEWKEVAGDRFARMLVSMETNLRAENAVLLARIDAFENAVKSASTMEDFRKKLADENRADTLTRSQVRQTRAAIENRTEEFASDDAVLPSA